MKKFLIFILPVFAILLAPDASAANSKILSANCGLWVWEESGSPYSNDDKFVILWPEGANEDITKIGHEFTVPAIIGHTERFAFNTVVSDFNFEIEFEVTKSPRDFSSPALRVRKASIIQGSLRAYSQSYWIEEESNITSTRLQMAIRQKLLTASISCGRSYGSSK